MKKIEEIIHIYKETRIKADELFQSAYVEAACLDNEFGIEKKWSQSCGQQMNLKRIPSEMVKEYQ